MTEKHNITKSATAEERIEMDKSNILALDVETAANRPDYFKHRVFNDIISIGVVDTKTGDAWYWSVRPPEEYRTGNPWWDGHHMSWETQKNEKTLDQLWPEIFSVLDGRHIVAHNAFGFDMEAMTKSAEHYDLEIPDWTWLDTKHEAAKAGHKRTSLKDLIPELGLPYESEKHHNALDDAKMLVPLFWELNKTALWTKHTVEKTETRATSPTSYRELEEAIEFNDFFGIGVDFDTVIQDPPNGEC